MRKTCPSHIYEETQSRELVSAVVNSVNVENNADHSIFDVSEVGKILRGWMVLHTALSFGQWKRAQ